MPRKKTTRQRLKRVSVKGERRPDVDWDRFAFALLTYCKQLMEDEAAAKAKRGKKP